MPEKPKADLRAAVISLVGARGPMSRSAIARQLQVSPATVTNLTKHLIKQGSLTECGTTPSDGGRPATLLDVTDARRYALGVKVTPNHLTMARVNLVGDPLPATSLDLDMRAPDALDHIVKAVSAEAAKHHSSLLGIGLAIPGFADPQEPWTVTCPTLGWNRLGLGQALNQATGLHIAIDNDVNALAIADRLYSPGNPDNSVLITIGFGIGAALTMGGRLLHGAGGAGELGHIVIDPAGELCACGQRGCLETLIGDDALVRRAKTMGLLKPNEGKTALNQLAESGTPQAQSLFFEAGELLGLQTANLVHLLDPEAITISGEGVDMWQHWEPGFLKSFRTHLPQHRRDLPVATHPWSDATWAHGAASLVFALPLTKRT